MPFNKSLLVEVDVREPDDIKEPTLDLIREAYPLAFKKESVLADIRYGNIWFELKSLEDFIATIKDGRYEFQLTNAVSTLHEYPDVEFFYCIYGDWYDLNKYSSMNPNAILGAIASIQIRRGIPVLILPNKRFMIYVICKIIEKAHDHKEIKPPKYKMRTDNRGLAMMMAGAERFQEKAALNGLEEYGTVQNLINAIVSDYKNVAKKIKQLGEKTSKRLRTTLTFDFKTKKELQKEILEDLKYEEEVKNENESLDEDINEETLDFDILTDKPVISDTIKRKVYNFILERSAKGEKTHTIKIVNSFNASKPMIIETLKTLELESQIYKSEEDSWSTY